LPRGRVEKEDFRGMATGGGDMPESETDFEDLEIPDEDDRDSVSKLYSYLKEGIWINSSHSEGMND
jgi:hypothetical protein